MKPNSDQRSEKRQIQKRHKKNTYIGRRLLGFLLAMVLLFTSGWSSFATSIGTEAETVQDSTEEPIQDSTEESIQDSTEEPIQDSTEEPIQDSTEEPIQDSTEESIENSAETIIQEPATNAAQSFAPGAVMQSAESAAPPSTSADEGENETTTDNGTPAENFVTLDSGAQEVPKTEVRLNLNGGTINGLIANGWTQIAGMYKKVVDQGSQITITNPYRSGYIFKGWQMNGSTGVSEDVLPNEGENEISITISGDCQLNAVWEEKLYRAEFYGGAGSTLQWTVNVPYGSVLWTMEGTAPWEEADLPWTEVDLDSRLETSVSKMETTLVTLNLEKSSSERKNYVIEVTRYTQKIQDDSSDILSESQYYYTFIMEDIPYFTYGGPDPEYEGHNFVEWRAVGPSGYAVITDGKSFDASYRTTGNYLFYVYYYLENGMKASDPNTYIIPKENQGQIDLTLEIPVIRYYTPEAGKLPTGISVAAGSETEETGWTGSAIVDVAAAFPNDSQEVNSSVIITVMYRPSFIDYKVVYHQQLVGEGANPDADYEEVGYLTGRTKIGSTVSLEDRPGTLKKMENGSEADAAIDFTGFEADSDTQSMIRRGKRLDQSLLDESGTAVIHMYYNRTYYYMYTLLDTNESDPFEPVRVQYGAELPKDRDGTMLIKTGYTFSKWMWYQTGQNGNLQLLGDGTKPESMPAHDVYAVAEWDREKTTMQVVYWIEDANSGSFQNTYQKEIEGVPTGDRLVMHLQSGKYNLTLQNDLTTSFPAFTETFEEAIVSKYGNTSYKQYFTFDPETTYEQEKNSHHADGNAAKTELYYEVKADGTTTINLYYKRNLYTLQFVIQRTDSSANDGGRRVATATNGSFGSSGWNGGLGSADTVFHDFTNPGLVKVDNPVTVFGSANVLQEYRIRDAVDRGDARAAVGRYARVQINGYSCLVYYLTARFEADIADLWPTMDNITVGGYYSNPYRYISMGSNKDSAYWKDREDKKISNKNILNQYSTMDSLIVNKRNGSALADNNGTANVTHQMYAYWANNKVKTYQYYFLYEVLDTTLNADDSIDEFSVDDIGSYEDGRIVKWRKTDTEKYGLYVYRKNNLPQNSTNDIWNQNQPARHGFDSMGMVVKLSQEYINQQKDYPNMSNFSGPGGNVYYFYKRKILNLSIYNVNGNWVPSDDLLKTPLKLTYVDEIEGKTVTESKSLAQLGWEDVVDSESEGQFIRLRYGAQLNVINQDSVTNAFQNKTEHNPDPLQNPFKSMGENKSYFYGWYKDQENSALVDWTVNAMQNMIQDEVLYAGWTTPKYRIIYTLNGGSWTDVVHMSFMITKVGDDPVVLYYPHNVTDPAKAQVYWYVPENNDYLYVKNCYIGTVDGLMEKVQGDESHYQLKPMTLQEMQNTSRYKPNIEIAFGRTVYLCNLGENGIDKSDTSHRKYVNQHIIAGGELTEPAVPVRNGYDFLGWYAFSEAGEGGFNKKVWLDQVLGTGEGLHSYHKDYVYIDSTGDAHLLYEDAESSGRLYYYDDQDGYQYRFQFGASVASQDRTLYAAWKGQQDNEGRIMYLVPVDEIAAKYVNSAWEKVTINGKEYYKVFEDEQLEEIQSGSTLVHEAKSLTTINDGKIWLPQKATINLEIGSGTPEGKNEREHVYSHEGDKTVFKIRIPYLDKEAYTYYAYFIYHPVKEPTYTVYYIDLTQAVIMGALTDYDDRFERDEKPPDPNSEYVKDKKGPFIYQVKPDTDNPDAEYGIVTVNAEVIEGYTVYERWTETLQLESDPSGNNIYFYYVKPSNKTTYNITYHFMENGNYNNDNNVKITGYPGQHGQILNLKNVVEDYEKMLDMAVRVRFYAYSSNAAEQDLYNRFKDMKIVSKADKINVSYSVDSSEPVTDDDTQKIKAAKAIVKDYVLDYYKPADGNQSVMLTEGLNVDVFLMDAQLTLKKKDASGNPLKDAVFELQRFRKLGTNETVGSNAEVITYENTQYVRDTAFETQNKKTDESGQIIFYDLSTDVNPGYIYQIKEVQAPVGHIPLAEPVYAKVPYQVTGENGTTTYYQVTYDIVNPGITYLPKAGGGGAAIPLYAGGGILAGGLLAGETLYGRKRIKRRKTK